MRFAVLVLALLAVSCSASTGGSGATPSLDDDLSRDEVFAVLRDRTAQVARAQSEADATLAEALTAVRELDRLIAGLRSPESVDTARESWPRVDGAFRSGGFEGLRERLFEVARAVDRARAAVLAAREHADGSWEEEYLAARDELLVAVREYAETTDRLARALITYWPVYDVLHEKTATFVEQRWFYRTSQEASDAYELAVSDNLDEFAAGQAAIQEALDAREKAAKRVNTAQAKVDEILERGPETGAPVPAPTRT